MVESKDNVKVAIRVRPLNEKEIQEGGKKCVVVNGLLNSIGVADNKVFMYDYVADEKTTQESLFENVGKPIANSCINGYNGTIFAYGQTGSGKTFTIQGQGAEYISPESSSYPLRGILPRCFEFIFASINSAVKTSNIEFLVKCSYLEIYQEQINDLLDPNPHNLQLREDMKKGIYVEGLIEQQARNVLQTYNLMKTGARNRHVSSTSMNKESSRSHSVFSLNIESKSNLEGLINFKCSRFHLIDLAGSERQKATACVGERLKEAGMINKSLSALGNVINSLVEVLEGKSRHVPYRDSKLTFLLKDSLGGNSKTCIIANISPSLSASAETLSTLKFAQRAKLIKNSAIVNEDTSGTVQLLKAEVKRLHEELQSLNNLAELAISNCPKCAGMVNLPNLLSTFEKTIDSEILLENNLRLRIEGEKKLNSKLKDQETMIETYQSLVIQLESQISHNEMILKFRDSTIESLQNGEESAEIQILTQEMQALKERIEGNEDLNKLMAENKILNEEIAEMRVELEGTLGSTKQENEEIKKFTEKLAEYLKATCNEKEKIKVFLQDLVSGKSLDDIFKGFEDKYESEILALKNEIHDLQADKSEMEAAGLTGSGEKFLEKTQRYEKELQDLRVKVFSETQAKDTLFIEKISLEKSLLEASQRVTELMNVKEQYCISESELEIARQQYEEKYTEHLLAMQEIDNLTESNEFMKTEIKELMGILSEKKTKIEEFEHAVGGLEKLNLEKSAMILALQDPTGNKTLALALSEVEHYKKQFLDLDQSFQSLKKQFSDLTVSFNALQKVNENSEIDLKSANFALNQLKEKITEGQRSLAETQESEQILQEEVERLKEIIQREKSHGEILRERMMNKHNEVFNKLQSEKTELVKEIDTLKSANFKMGFELGELKKFNGQGKDELLAEKRRCERVTAELIESKVEIEKVKKELFVKVENLTEKLEKEEKENEEIIKVKGKMEAEISELKNQVERIKQLANENDRILGELEVEKSERLKAGLLKKEAENLKQKLEEELKIVQNDKNVLTKQLAKVEAVKCEVERGADLLAKEKEKIAEETQQIICEKENLTVEAKLLKLEKENLLSEVKYLSVDKEKCQKSVETLQIDNLELKKVQESQKKMLNLLENDKKHLSGQVRHLQLNLEDLEQKLKSLEDLLDSEESSKRSIIGEKDQLQTFYFQSIESVQKIENALKNANTELDKEKNKNKSLSMEYECVKVAQEEVLKKFNNHLVRYTELEEKWQKECEKRRVLEGLSKDVKEENSGLLKLVKDQQEKIGSLENQLKLIINQQLSIKENLESLQKNSESSLNSQIESFKMKEKEVEIKAEHLESKLQEILEEKNKEIQKIESALQGLKLQLSESHSTWQALNQEYQFCLNKNQELFNLIEEKNTKNKEQEILCINLLNDKEQKKLLLDSLNTQISDLKKSLQTTQSHLEESRITNFRLANENQDLKFSLSKVSDENLKALNELEMKNLMISELEKEKNIHKEKSMELERSFQDIVMKDKKKKLVIEVEVEELKKKLEGFVKEREENLSVTKENEEKLKRAEEKMLGQSKIIKNYLESIQSLEGSLKAAEDCKNALSVQMEQFKVQENVYILEISSLISQVNLANEHHSSKVAEVQKLNEKLKEQGKSLLDLNKQISDLNVKLQESLENNQNISKQSNENLTSYHLVNRELTMCQDEMKKLNEELFKLKDELRKKNDSLKDSKNDGKYTREEVAGWKQCIEEKNVTIQDLKKELDLLKQDMEQNNNENYHEKQCEYLTRLLKVKEKELAELKSKGIIDLESSLDLKKKELELKKECSALNQLTNVKNDLASSLEARESLMNELKTVKDNEIRTKRDLSDMKNLLIYVREDNMRLLKEITKLNEEHLKMQEKIDSEKNEVQVLKNKKLEDMVNLLENQVRIKSTELEKCNRRLTEIKKKEVDEMSIRKELEKQAEEIRNLTQDLARITDFVLSLPSINGDSEDSSVIERTLKVVKLLYNEVQQREKEPVERKKWKRADPTSGKVPPPPGHPMSSASEKSLRVQSPGMKLKKFK